MSASLSNLVHPHTGQIYLGDLRKALLHIYDGGSYGEIVNTNIIVSILQ